MNKYINTSNKFGKIIFSTDVPNNEVVKEFNELNDTEKLLFYKYLIFLNDANIDKGCHIYAVNHILFNMSDLWKNPPPFVEESESSMFSDDMYFPVFKQHSPYPFEYGELTKDSFDEKVKKYHEYFQKQAIEA